MPTIPVPVVVNFTGISYNNGAWSGTPSWTVPRTVQVHPGSNTINWNLNAAVSSGYAAKFTTDGIYFPPSSQWPGGTPQRVNDGLVRAEDDFTTIAAPTDYYYGVKVTLTQTASGQSSTFTYDPDVENEPH